MGMYASLSKGDLIEMNNKKLSRLLEPNLKLYYGLNLGMLMELISRRMFQGDAELSEGLIEIGRQQIGLFDPEAMEAYTETGEDEL